MRSGMSGTEDLRSSLIFGPLAAEGNISSKGHFELRR